MATSISWTDTLGSATLASSVAAPGDRLSDWTTIPDNKQVERETLTGAGFAIRFAELYDASFRLEHIANADGALVARFVRHCRNFGTFALATGDLAARTYPTLQCVVGSPPSFSYQDKVTLEWTLVLPRVRNVAASPVELVCLYG